jgi:hypothetical protein
MKEATVRVHNHETRAFTMLVFGGDPILAALLIGSTVLYYWQLYHIMQRNKSKSGSYWRD